MITKAERAAAAVLVATSLLACSEATEPAVCHERVAVTVEESANLTISWTPNTCRMMELDISEAGTAIKWIVFSPNQENVLLPPVIYGRSPGNGLTAGMPEPLWPGVVYDVTLVRKAADGNHQYVAGEASFVPSRSWP